MPQTLPTRSRVVSIRLGALALLAAMPASVASGTEPAPPCAIRLAEATICPAFHLLGNANEEDRIEAVSGDGATLVGHVVDPKAPTPSAWGDPVHIPARWVHGELEALGSAAGLLHRIRDGGLARRLGGRRHCDLRDLRVGGLRVARRRVRSAPVRVVGDAEIWYADDGDTLIPTGISDGRRGRRLRYLGQRALAARRLA